jgi:ribonuclease Z
VSASRRLAGLGCRQPISPFTSSIGSVAAASCLRSSLVAAALAACFALTLGASAAETRPCMVVTVTGSQGGSGLFNGLAGPGTLIRYGEDSNDCNAMRLQFDAGRGTSLRLSQVGVQPEQLDAIFFTHMHSDHAEGFIDIVQLRWHNVGPRLDVVFSADAVSPLGHTLSCKKFAAHISDALIPAGEIAQRLTEDKQRVPWWPAELTHVITFEPRDEPQTVWISGDVRVSAIHSTHMPGHASYRVDKPAGSVVIGGDAGNDKLAPPRDHSPPTKSRSSPKVPT